MVLPDFTVEHLKQLPLRAIVAFAVRCARRVEALAQLPEGHPGRGRVQVAVEASLRIAEGFASGSNAPLADSVVEPVDASLLGEGAPLGAEAALSAVSDAAHAATSAWHLVDSLAAEKDEPHELKTAEARKLRGAVAFVTADVAALSAFTAALEAYESLGYHNEEFVAAALDDYNRLVSLKLGVYPEAGDPIDPSPEGPLGPL